MPSTRIKIKRERDTGLAGDFRSDFDTVSIEFSWGADASEMVEKFAGLMVAMGYGQGSVVDAMFDYANCATQQEASDADV